MAKRVHTHLLIDDPSSAVQEAREGLSSYPDSKSLQLALIRALCAAGSEIEALEEWKAVTATHGELLDDRTALETLAWGVLNKGDSSSQLSIRVNALIGAAMTRDAKALPLILGAMRSSNSMLRSVAVSLAAGYGDFPLQDEITRMLKSEPIWYVRLELIRAVGALKMAHAKELLIEIIGNPRTMLEEKTAAIVSLVTLYDSIGESELALLIQSNRAGLRELACQVISHLDLRDQVSMLLPLTSDSHPLVRMSALNTLALLGIERIEDKPLMEDRRISRLIADPVAEVAITASWVALLRGDGRGERSLRKWALKGNPQHARLAAGALAISGEKGSALSEELMELSSDPYVRLTLAVGLIGQRTNVERACQVLAEGLTMGDKWMWDTSFNPLFRSISPSKVPLSGQIPNYPEAINQVTRLEILQILCIMQYRGAQEAVKEFLKVHTWGVVGAAASTLLREGDDEALDVVRALLDDPEEKVRLQAALILAQLSSDKQAIAVLKSAYPRVHREIKIHILQAIAKLADRSAIAFLLDRLNEPFQVLRVVAATAIIQCLYH